MPFVCKSLVSLAHYYHAPTVYRLRVVVGLESQTVTHFITGDTVVYHTLTPGSTKKTYY